MTTRNSDQRLTEAERLRRLPRKQRAEYRAAKRRYAREKREYEARVATEKLRIEKAKAKAKAEREAYEARQAALKPVYISPKGEEPRIIGYAASPEERKQVMKEYKAAEKRARLRRREVPIIVKEGEPPKEMMIGERVLPSAPREIITKEELIEPKITYEEAPAVTLMKRAVGLGPTLREAIPKPIKKEYVEKIEKPVKEYAEAWGEVATGLAIKYPLPLDPLQITRKARMIQLERREEREKHIAKVEKEFQVFAERAVTREEALIEKERAEKVFKTPEEELMWTYGRIARGERVVKERIEKITPEFEEFAIKTMPTVWERLWGKTRAERAKELGIVALAAIPVGAITAPIALPVTIPRMVLDPGESLKGMKEAFIQAPAVTVGRTVGGVMALTALGLGARKIYKGIREARAVSLAKEMKIRMKPMIRREMIKHPEYKEFRTRITTEAIRPTVMRKHLEIKKGVTYTPWKKEVIIKQPKVLTPRQEILYWVKRGKIAPIKYRWTIKGVPKGKISYGRTEIPWKKYGVRGEKIYGKPEIQIRLKPAPKGYPKLRIQETMRHELEHAYRPKFPEQQIEWMGAREPSPFIATKLKTVVQPKLMIDIITKEKKLPFTLRGWGQFRRYYVGEKGLGAGVAGMELYKRGKLVMRTIYREPRAEIIGEKLKAKPVSLEFYRVSPMKLRKPVVVAGKMELVGKELIVPKEYQYAQPTLRWLHKYSTIEAKYQFKGIIPSETKAAMVLRREYAELGVARIRVVYPYEEIIAKRVGMYEEWRAMARVEAVRKEITPLPEPIWKLPKFKLSKLPKIAKVAEKPWIPVKGVDRYGFPRVEQIPIAPERVGVALPPFEMMARETIRRFYAAEPTAVRPAVGIAPALGVAPRLRIEEMTRQIAKPRVMLREIAKPREMMREAVVPREQVMLRTAIQPRLALREMVALKQMPKLKVALKITAPIPPITPAIPTAPIITAPLIPYAPPIRRRKPKVAKVKLLKLLKKYKPSLIGMYLGVEEHASILRKQLTGLEPRGIVRRKKK